MSFIILLTAGILFYLKFKSPVYIYDITFIDNSEIKAEITKIQKQILSGRGTYT